MDLKLFMLILAAVFCSFTGKAASSASNPMQGVTVTGTVTDVQGDPMPGVNVVVQGTTIGVTSDFNGKYSITLPAQDAVLVFSFVGFRMQDHVVGNRTVIDVVMEESAQEIEEVVVVGYGIQKRTHLTGSVSQISSKELMKAPMQNVSNLLTGKLSGLTSIQNSGKPGDDFTTLYLRGSRSFNGGNAPLIIVDGVPRSINFLNPNDIESVSVLKDAAAYIYGVRGGNGVILVTTKSGGETAPQISYDGSFTATQNTAMPEFLNATDFMYWHNKAREMDGLTPLWTADIQNRVMTNDPESIWGQTDWLGKIFRTGFTQQHNVSATGGSDRVKYYTSIGLMNQEGTLHNTDFQRYNMRTNLDVKVAKNLKFVANLAGFRTDRNWPASDIGNQTEYSPIRQAINCIPIIKSEYKDMPTGWWGGVYVVNPVAALNESGYKQQTRYRLDTNFKLEYDFSDLTDVLKGLKFSVFGSYNYSQTVDRNYDRYYRLYSVNNTYDETIVGASGYSQGNAFTKSSSWGNDWMLRPQIEYLRDFMGKHTVGATLLFEEQKAYSDTMTAIKRGYFSDDPVDISLGTELPVGNPATGSFSYSGIKSYVGRLNYAFSNKYLAEFAFRYDGSYRFDPDNRWGFFPSGSLGWVISQEEFFSNALPIVDFLKVRFSYGQAGKDDVIFNGNQRYFQYQSSYAIAQNSMAMGGRSIAQFYTSNAYVFRTITWESLETYNVGIDLNMWKGKLGMELDMFYTYTGNILESVGGNYPPSVAGYYPSHQNSGKAENRGIEITLKHLNRINQDWSYNLRGNISYARNKVLHRAMADNHPNYRPQVGMPMNAKYGFKALGLFQTQEEIDQYPAAPSGWVNPGDLKYLDVNGDGRISMDHDYVKIGRGEIPEINFNFNIDVTWKNLSLSMVWQGVSHCDYELSGVYGTGVISSTVYTSPFGGGNSPYYLIEDAWRPDNPNAKYPRLTTRANGNNAWQSSWWIVNGEYLRLKNLNISFHVPDNIITRTPFSGINIYLAGTNLITFSHFKYIDPESPSVSNGYYPQQKTYSIGFNVTF